MFKLRLGIILFLCLLTMPSFAQETLIFWSTEFQPERVARQEAIIAAFETAHPNVDVQLVVANENLITQLVDLNLATGTNPHVILHPVQLSAQWVQAGVLDANAATSIIQALDASTFSPRALSLVQVSDGVYASVPSDGWGQLLLYRQDLFEAAGLAVPNSYEMILAGAQALHNPNSGFYGFCGANSPSEVYTWQVFEHLALANGASFVDAAGNITFDSPAMVESLQFYADLMHTAGQTEAAWYWQQTRGNYLAGKCGMIIWSPFILDEMAGLRDNVLPTCAECAADSAFIAKNTGIVSAITGYSNTVPATWGSTFNLGIAPDAPPSASDFVLFWFNQAYVDALAVAPEGKFPMRRGTPENPTAFIEAWSQLLVGVDRQAPLSEFYDSMTLETIVNGADSYSRMGFDVGQNLLASELGSRYIIPERLVAVLEDNLSPELAAQEIQEAIIALQAELATQP